MSGIHKITISDTTVLCTDEELQKLERVCANFTGYTLEDWVQMDDHYEGEEPETKEILFAELNAPVSDDEELDTSYWGDDGCRPNSIADIDAQRYYKCYFNVLIFLDGCDTFFRSTSEEDDD